MKDTSNIDTDGCDPMEILSAARFVAGNPGFRMVIVDRGDTGSLATHPSLSGDREQKRRRFTPPKDRRGDR